MSDAERRKLNQALLSALVREQKELETIYAHLKALIAAPEVGDWRAALRGLLPENRPTDELKADLRKAGLGDLADRLAALEREGRDG